MTPQQLIAEYDALIERAKEIIRESYAGYYAHLQNEQCARLSVADDPEDDRIFISWPEIDLSYGEHSVECYMQDFPAHLLSMPADEFAQWKAAAIQKGKEDEEIRQAALLERDRLNELTTLAALKAKYE